VVTNAELTLGVRLAKSSEIAEHRAATLAAAMSARITSGTFGNEFELTSNGCSASGILVERL
jgi:hypothetical protein